MKKAMSFFLIFFFLNSNRAFADNRAINITLDSSVKIAMNNSYRIKQLRLGIERTRYWLKAERAGLKSKFYMNISTPEYQNLSDYKWDSVLQRDEIVRVNTQKWQMNFSILQPIIFFGYPTNGYLSLNNQIYKYIQKDGDKNDINYYNRYFLKFQQPFFLPNNLKNKIDLAELDLQDNELSFIDDQVNFLGQIADDYYSLFKLSYYNEIYSHQIENLGKVSKLVYKISSEDTTRSIEAIQIQVELANIQEKMLQNKSELRLASSRFKQRLRLDDTDDIIIKPEIQLDTINVDMQQATNYGYTLRTSMRSLDNRIKRNKIDLNNVKGYNSFHMNLEMTYGIEKQDDSYANLWLENDNSNSVVLTAYIPLWDWGQRNARIEAQKITLQKTNLSIEETRSKIKSEITSAVSNLEEYQKRALNMKSNLEMAKEITEQSIVLYQKDKISLQDLLQSINRQTDTELNFLDAYLGFKKSLLALTSNTYYDYEKKTSLLSQFNMSN